MPTPRFPAKWLLSLHFFFNLKIYRKVNVERFLLIDEQLLLTYGYKETYALDTCQLLKALF